MSPSDVQSAENYGEIFPYFVYLCQTWLYNIVMLRLQNYEIIFIGSRYERKIYDEMAL